MEDIVKQQNENAIALQQALSNFKKSRAERKTLEHLQRKLEELTKAWAHFNKVDKQIRSLNPALQEDHVYFTSKLYETVGEKFNEVVTRIENEIRMVMDTANKKQANLADQNINTTSSKPEILEKPSLSHIQRKVIEIVQRMTMEVLNDCTIRSADYYQLKLKTLDQHWAIVQQLHEKLWATVDDYNYDQFISKEEQYHRSIL